MGRKKKTRTDADGIEIPDLDFGEFEFSDDDLDFGLFKVDKNNTADTESRYLPPRLRPMKGDQIMYDNAVKLAKDLRLESGMRADVIISGAFIFGDFIEAYLTTHMAKAIKMTISTLSMSRANVDSLKTLLDKGYVDELNLIISDYFYSHEINNLIPYIYENLDIEDRFQLAVAGVHTKTVHFITLGGKKIVMQGSANLRSSANIEQFIIEENPEVYDFYDEVLDKIIEEYKTINKPIRVSPLWKLLTTKKFND